MSLHLSVDRPGEDETLVVTDMFLLEGWTYSDAGTPELTVSYAGHQATVAAGGFRTDVSDALRIGPHRGYVATGSTAGLPAGTLEIVVTATAPDGETASITRTVQVADRDGELPDRPRPLSAPSERLDPRLAPGSLTHAEHVARYRWVAPLAAGKDVLDAGCGVGYGSALLAAAGARSVTGVDAFAAAVLEARQQDRHASTFLVGDLRDLPLEDDSVDLVVCFEVIEHIDEQERLISELRRVLRPDGVLVVSTPVPGAIAVHNPHHVREIDAEQLAALLRSTFARVRVLAQHSAIASVLDAPLPREAAPAMTWATGPVDPMYTLAIAGDAELPDLTPSGVLATGADIGALISEHYVLADELLRTQADLAAQRARAERAESALAALQAAHDDLHEQARVTHDSRSWRLTRPLREAAVTARELRRPRP